MMNEPIEYFWDDDELLGVIVRATASASMTSFLTPPDLRLQIGFVVHAQGREVKPHIHQPVERKTQGTSEALFLRSGKCELTIYDRQNRLIATRVLGEGDVVLLHAGGHGLRMLEDTVLLEIKQGPYPGVQEKKILKP